MRRAINRTTDQTDTVVTTCTPEIIALDIAPIFTTHAFNHCIEHLKAFTEFGNHLQYITFGDDLIGEGATHQTILPGRHS